MAYPRKSLTSLLSCIEREACEADRDAVNALCAGMHMVVQNHIDNVYRDNQDYILQGLTKHQLMQVQDFIRSFKK